jgi:transposase
MIARQYARAYVKTNKNDAADAEAICEAALRPTMRFVRPKSLDQQAMQMLHRARDLLIRQRTMLVNALRGHQVSRSRGAPLLSNHRNTSAKPL